MRLTRQQHAVEVLQHGQGVVRELVDRRNQHGHAAGAGNGPAVRLTAGEGVALAFVAERQHASAHGDQRRWLAHRPPIVGVRMLRRPCRLVADARQPRRQVAGWEGRGFHLHAHTVRRDDHRLPDTWIPSGRGRPPGSKTVSKADPDGVGTGKCRRGVPTWSVSTSPEACLQSARVAVEIGVDRLMGGQQVVETIQLLEGASIEYLPFPGVPTGHPTRLGGDIALVERQCREFADMGCAGVDLLAYRATEAEPLDLVKAARRGTDGYLVVAGRCRPYARIADLRHAERTRSPSVLRCSTVRSRRGRGV